MKDKCLKIFQLWVRSKKLTPIEAQSIWDLRNTWDISKLSRKFGVGRTAIRDIIIGKTWKNLDRGDV